MSDIIENINNTLNQKIPVAAFMQIKVESYDGQQLSMSAPIEPNTNDKNTAFAGSISTLATLAGWALTTLYINERYGACNVAAMDCAIEFKVPLSGNLTAVVQLPEAVVLGKLNKLVEKKRVGKMPLSVNISSDAKSDQGVGVLMHATYAIKLTSLRS